MITIQLESKFRVVTKNEEQNRLIEKQSKTIDPSTKFHMGFSQLDEKVMQILANLLKLKFDKLVALGKMKNLE